jgi:hypothetical protein
VSAVQVPHGVSLLGWSIFQNTMNSFLKLNLNSVYKITTNHRQNVLLIFKFSSTLSYYTVGDTVVGRTALKLNSGRLGGWLEGETRRDILRQVSARARHSLRKLDNETEFFFGNAGFFSEVFGENSGMISFGKLRRARRAALEASLEHAGMTRRP